MTSPEKRAEMEAMRQRELNAMRHPRPAEEPPFVDPSAERATVGDQGNQIRPADAGKMNVATSPYKQVSYEAPVGDDGKTASTTVATSPQSSCPQGGQQPCGCPSCNGHSYPPALPAYPNYYPAPPFYPADEYIFDGGDRPFRAMATKDGRLVGVEQEDTVAQFDRVTPNYRGKDAMGNTVVKYDTVPGTNHIQPSNVVPIYAPRFAAVRKVYGMIARQSNQKAGGVNRRIGLVGKTDVTVTSTVAEHLQPNRHKQNLAPNRHQENLQGLRIRQRENVISIRDGFKAFEDLAIIRRGHADQSEKAVLAIRMLAAKTWQNNLGLQVQVGGLPAFQTEGHNSPEDVTHYELPKGKNRLRIVKIADKQDAQSGDIVEFTIRIDNVGDTTVGNITLIDNLTTRLEYVDQSQSASVDAKFLSQLNEGETLVLRWDLTKPLKVGKGAIIRFKCRVR